MDALHLFENDRLVPVVVISRAEHAVPLAALLLNAGINAIEVTLRTPAALDAIAAIARNVPDIRVGAGSVRTITQMDQVHEIGAEFCVCPGSSDKLLGHADRLAMPFVPGAQTATEMLRLLERGYVLQKFFPAELSGGLPQLQAISAPLPELRFFPTGGIDAARARAYLDFAPVCCVGGSWFVPAATLAAGDFDNLARLAATAVDALRAS